MYRDQKKTGYKITQQDLAEFCKCGNRDTMRRYIKVAEAFEEEYGEFLEDFHKRIKDKKELEAWKRGQIFNSALDINIDENGGF